MNLFFIWLDMTFYLCYLSKILLEVWCMEINIQLIFVTRKVVRQCMKNNTCIYHPINLSVYLFVCLSVKLLMHYYLYISIPLSSRFWRHHKMQITHHSSCVMERETMLFLMNGVMRPLGICESYKSKENFILSLGCSILCAGRNSRCSIIGSYRFCQKYRS